MDQIIIKYKEAYSILAITIMVIIIQGCSINKDDSTGYFNCTSFQNQTECEISNILLSQDKTRCNTLGLEEKKDCLAYFGILSKQYDECDNLDEKSKEICYLGIFYATMDFMKCYEYPYASQTLSSMYDETQHNFSKQERINGCNRLILSENYNKEGICDLNPEWIWGYIYPENESWADYCSDFMTEIRSRTVNDIAECSEESGIMIDFCIYNYARSIKNQEVCNTIKDSILNDSCKFVIAIDIGNIDDCPKSSLHAGCVLRILSAQ